ncbi:hypothetical protein D3C81_689510 [compost metagenome]
MTYEEFRRQLGKAGLSVKAFAGLIKQNPNSISNHAVQGDVPPHIAVIAALMAEMAERGIDYRTVLTRIDFSPCKPRGGSGKGKFRGSNAGLPKVTANL